MPDEPFSLSDAGNQIGALLAPEEPAPERPRGPDGKFLPTKPQEPEAEEAPSDESPPEVPAAENAPEPEATEEPELPPVRALKVKVDGMEQEVPEDEVIKGYQRMADYTRKTQALAEERKRFEAEELAAVRAEREEYASRLTALQEAVQALAPDREPDWNSLRNTMSPDEFTSAFAEYQGTRQRIEKIRAERDRVDALTREDSDRVRAGRLRGEREKLMDALPDLKDPDKGKALTADLYAYGATLGFTEDMVNSVEDHRLLVLLDKARRFDEAQRRKPKIEEKIHRAVDALKPSGAASHPKPSEVERGQAKLMQSGRVEDAALLITQQLEAQKKKK